MLLMIALSVSAIFFQRCYSPCSYL